MERYIFETSNPEDTKALLDKAEQLGLIPDRQAAEQAIAKKQPFLQWVQPNPDENPYDACVRILHALKKLRND